MRWVVASERALALSTHMKNVATASKTHRRYVKTCFTLPIDA
jgi:hypothetical protein